MAIQYSFKNMIPSCNSTCLDKFGCPSDRCPDFTIRRHDTKPEFKVSVKDCNGPLDIQGLVVEVNMWANAKLKKTITPDCEYISLANDIGFEQVMVGDIIIMDRVRSPEYMTVIAFDECNKLIRVQRGYRDTEPSSWKKGNPLKIFRILNAPAQTEIVFEDINNVDGSVEEDVLSQSFLVYEWSPEDVCLPGCYWLEFKLLKMKNIVLYLPGGYWNGNFNVLDGTYYTGTVYSESSVKLSYNGVEDKYYLDNNAWTGSVNLYNDKYYTGSVYDDGSVILDYLDIPSDETIGYNPVFSNVGISYTPTNEEDEEYSSNVTECNEINNNISCAISFTNPSLKPKDFGCSLGENVEWVRRFPTQGEGFLIKIENSLTKELL